MKTLSTPAGSRSFYAVATNIDEVKKFPNLCLFNWIDMKAKVNFSNMKQVHFNDKESADKLYQLIKNLDILVFKNWA